MLDLFSPPSTLSLTNDDPFSRRFGKSLPKQLAAEASGMDWSAFWATFHADAGPLQLTNFTAQHTGDTVHCHAEIQRDLSIASLDETATGPIAALTAMLYRIGTPLEIVSLHQQETPEGTMTFILGEYDGQQRWAIGSGEESIASALIAAANRLHFHDNY